jgi:hypothetical protein
VVYPTLLPLMRTSRLPAVDWTDAPADLNGLVRFGERRNLVSARVSSRFKRTMLYSCVHSAGLHGKFIYVARRPIARGVQMHPLQIRMHPSGICKISKTNMLISPLEYVRQSTASTYCLCRTAVAGNNSFSNMYAYVLRCFIECYGAQYVIKVLILRSWQKHT